MAHHFLLIAAVQMLKSNKLNVVRYFQSQFCVLLFKFDWIYLKIIKFSLKWICAFGSSNRQSSQKRF